MILDQAHQLCNGHDQLAFGFEIDTRIPNPEFSHRVQEALIKMRFHSPLVGSNIKTGNARPEGPRRFWEYRTCSTTEDARQWAVRALRVTPVDNVQVFLKGLVSKRLEDTQLVDLRDQPFACYLLVDTVGSPRAIIFHVSHALMDAAGALAISKLFLRWIVQGPDHIGIDGLRWGEEYKNLPPGPVAACGGLKPGWESSCSTMLTDIQKALSRTPAPHSLKPSRPDIMDLGKLVYTKKVVSRETSERIIQATRVLGFSVTQLFNAAFAMATFRYHPKGVDNVDNAHVTLYPAM
ncbi:hypothetical protein FRB99_007253 [Tulasnella sp. 403]|nr:hypothetical protein FRB99_007253 [Tulasnella sp. 403]